MVRAPNRRGQGARLREDIVSAASRLLERTGSEDAVTLRAVAREAGITAPAIYAHFDGPADIVLAVVQETFGELTQALLAAPHRADDPVERLRAVGSAYLAFAAERPHHYRVLFQRHRVEQPVPTADCDGPAVTVRTIPGAEAFGALLDAVAACIDTGASTATSAEAAATRMWIGLHGQATLQASLPWFPWPDTHQLADEVCARLADLRPPDIKGARSAGGARAARAPRRR
ncbi:TetR/AcrR family transcriptional regulator [Jatrophihabitans fulvus]